MTAIVGILNKHAAAMAADSAVTIDGQKVFNSANKLFALSKFKPVAIAFYNNMNLVNCPWEVVTKEYRHHLGANGFDTLREYVADFFNFLKAKNYFCSEKDQKEFLNWQFNGYIKGLLDKMDKTNLKAAFEDKVRNDEANIYHKLPTMACYNGMTVDDFKRITADELDSCLAFVKANYGIDFDLNVLALHLYSYFIKDQLLANVTGIVFCGYGDKEIYPSIYNYETYVVIDHQLSIYPHDERSCEIGKPALVNPANTKPTTAVIETYAQADVMDTIIHGVAPSVRDIYMRNLAVPLEGVLKDISKKVGDPGVTKTVDDFIKKDLKTYVNDYLKECTIAAQNEYAQPFLNSITSLEKEDLADFAESMIKLTSIKRKVSPSLATVDGPIDVMVVSKAEGVIWIKRKHYFTSDLNHSFFDNYYKR